MDFNAKLGEEYVHNDPNKRSRNGKILSEIIEERNLKVVNSSEKCTGTITRSRTTSKGTEQSVIEHFTTKQNSN